MEDIKDSIDKLFDEFSTESMAMVFGKPKQPRYSFTPEAESKKRKISPDDTNNDISTISVPDDSRNTTVDSLNSSQGLLWEVRRMKSDILDQNSTITQLRNELESRNAVHVRMESMYSVKVASLQKQIDSNTFKLRESDKYLKHLRRRDASSKEELVKATNQLAQQKCQFDEANSLLQRGKAEAEETVRHLRYEITSKLATAEHQFVKQSLEYSNAREELEKLLDTTNHLQEKAHKYTELEAKFEVQRNELERSHRRVAELQNEIAAFGEWKDMAKTFQQRVAKVPDLEKELERLRRENKSIRDTIGNKLQLEEEVFDLKTRLGQHQQVNDSLVAVQTTLKAMEAELHDYQAVARDHCGVHSIVSAGQLRARIEAMLRNDLVLKNDTCSAKSEKDSAAAELHAVKKELEVVTKNNDQLQTSLRYHKTSMHRVQKKLSLVAKERDCFKLLIDNYEKDLTISGAVSDMHPDSQIRVKLDMLEKSIDGYKEIVATLERDLQMAKSLPDLGLVDAASAENYEKFRKDMDVLRADNERLVRRKDELELMLEHSSLKGAYNLDKYKVLHMSVNPLSEAHETHKVELEKLQAEIERLRRKNRKLEQDHAELTIRMSNDTTTNNMTCDLKEMSSLREQLKSLESKYKHQKELYKQASQEFREVCYMLFGYRVDRIGANNYYRISSVYAETEDEYLNFRLAESGGLDMLSSNYSLTLADMVNTYLGEHASLPAFLCSLNLELFNRTTVALHR